VRECLFLLFVHTDDIPNENFHVSVEEKGKVFIVKETLDSNIEKHFTIPELSRLVGMNEFRLKFAFKQTFGMGMFEYQKEKRLKEAKRLIVETDKPAKVVAKLTGYARITSFVTEFRKYFGYTPGSLRRK
jgi:AraC-like DNA-binding protein